MSEREPAHNKTSPTPPQATQASSPLLHQNSFTSGLSESLGDNSNISKELRGIQSKTIRRSLNWQNISVEAPSRSAGRSLPGGIQLQQEEPSTVSGSRVSTDLAQKPLIARTPFNGRNIPVEAPSRSAASSAYSGGIQRLETSDLKEQEESTESLQMQPEEEIQTKSSEGEPEEKEEQNQEVVQAKLTVGAPGDKYEQEADSMATKVMTMPDSAIQQPIQRQTGEETEAVQMQPLVNSITPLLQRSSEKQGKSVNVKEEVDKASSPEPSFLFRADDSYQKGTSVGIELDSEEAETADIQNPLDHVIHKESGDSSRYRSFSTAMSFPGGAGPKRFTKKNKILKVAWEALQQLASDGKIRIYTPEQVAEMIRQNPKKQISKQANNVKAAMEKNGEILIEGQIPGDLIVMAK